MPADPAASRSDFLRTWLLWTAGFLAFPIAGIAGDLAAGRVDDALAALLGGLVSGLVVGTGQVLVSRRRLDPRRWIPATAIGMGAGLLLGAATVGYGTSLGDLALMGALTGIVLGPAQALALPVRTHQRWAWAVALPILWALGWNNVSELRSNLTWSTPSPLANTAAVSNVAGAEIPAAIERAEQTARGAGLDGLIKIGIEYWNTGYYSNPIVQKNLDAALSATGQTEATKYWKAAQRDADGNGFGPSGDAAWAWLVNLQHTYFVSDCLDIGKPQIEPQDLLAAVTDRTHEL
ncbi:hypothetical protein OHA18_42075 [Kribbella sp. NBC_00709]|uniref:hypothetical protein n=1 Tax=Kribbella sp. NBC_00709 TaxID=2975972 RepID=UPI002E2C50F4|nr:hypothetical protein [Kribbella sp. NBC_00709]